MKKRILIIGVTGFLGKALWKFLEKEYPQINLYGIARHLRGTSPKIFQCDLNETHKFKGLLSRIYPDYIFNFAGGRVKSERQLFRSNFSAALSLFRAVSDTPRIRARIIIPGTAAEYGALPANKRFLEENVLPHPSSWYGLVKLMQTNLALMYAKKGLDIVVARMFNVVGEGVLPDLAIGRFAQEIVMIERGLKEPVLTTRNLSGCRDFLDVDDVCSALMALARDGQSGEVYNVCSGKSYLIRDLLDQLLHMSWRKDIKIHEDIHRVSESFDVIGANTKLRRLTQWEPRVSIKQSLGKTLKYYRKISAGDSP